MVKEMSSETTPITGAEPEATSNNPCIRRSNLRLLILTVLYLLFLVIGAAVFAAIEGPRESALVEHMQNVRSAFYSKHKDCIS
ncbi:unnamed protein product, partial [Candidula unifasciata]